MKNQAGSPFADRDARSVPRLLVPILIAFTLFALMATVAGLMVVAFERYFREETLPPQWSPSRNWSITLTGKQLLGRIEVTAFASVVGGRSRRMGVKGQARSFAEFRERFSRLELTEDAAYLEGQPFALRPDLNNWQLVAPRTPSASPASNDR